MEATVETMNLKKSGEEKFARLISSLFHPLLMPTYGFVIIFFTHNYISEFIPLNLKLLLLSVIFVFTFLFPFINVLFLLKRGRINSLSMESTAERSLPYALAALYYFALYYLFYSTQLSAFFKVLILGAALSVLLTFVVNFKWKISAHAVGIGGIIGAMLATTYRLQIELNAVLMLLIIVAGIVGYARLKLNAHNPSQVYTGFLLGFLVEFFLIFFY